MVSVLTFTKQTFALLALALVANGLPVEERSDSPGFVQLNFVVEQGNGTSSTLASLAKRGDYALPLTNIQNNQYRTNLNFGSSKQSESVVLDTGSADLWVSDVSTGYSDYSPSKSTTAKTNHQVFQISYGDGKQSAQGYYYTDDVQIPNGPTIPNLKFADLTSNPYAIPGILGIGFEALEASSSSAYPNFPQALKDSGAVAKNAYSLYLNDYSSQSGSIIFGGKDTAKYDTLTTIPITDPHYFAVGINSITAPDGTVIKDGEGAVLDSGTSFTYLEDSIIQSLAKTIPGATYNSANGNIVLSGSSLPSGQYITYSLNGVDIKVPLNQLVTFNFNPQNQQIPGYALAVASNKFLGISLLGDSFLRSAYVVYDLDDKNVQIGQVKYTTDSNVVAL